MPPRYERFKHAKLNFTNAFINYFKQAAVEASQQIINGYVDRYGTAQKRLDLVLEEPGADQINQPIGSIITAEIAEPGKITMMKGQIRSPREFQEVLVHALAHALEDGVPQMFKQPVQLDHNTWITGIRGFSLIIKHGDEDTEFNGIEEGGAEYLAQDYLSGYESKTLDYYMVNRLTTLLAEVGSLRSSVVARLLFTHKLYEFLGTVIGQNTISDDQLLMAVDAYSKVYNMEGLNENEIFKLNLDENRSMRQGKPEQIVRKILEELLSDLTNTELHQIINALRKALQNPLSVKQLQEWLEGKVVNIRKNFTLPDGNLNIQAVNQEIDEYEQNPSYMLVTPDKADLLIKSFIHIIKRIIPAESIMAFIYAFRNQIQHELEHVQLAIQYAKAKYPHINLQPQIGVFFANENGYLGFQPFMVLGKIDENMTAEIYWDIISAGLKTNDKSAGDLGLLNNLSPNKEN